MEDPRVQRSKAFKVWYKTLTDKEKGIVDTRIGLYINKGFLVKTKLLDTDYGLYEFKWKNGMRVYFSMIEDEYGRLMLLLLGGNKNSQGKDINEAKNIVLKAVEKIVDKKTTKEELKKSLVKRREGHDQA